VLIVPSDDIAAQASGLDLAACLRRPLRTPLLSAALRQALARLADRSAPPETAAQAMASPAPPALPGVPQTAPSDTEPRHFLPVLDKGEQRAIPIGAVLYLRAELKYVSIRTADREYLTEEPLTVLLDAFPGHFVRVHRNTLVARHAICGARRVAAGHHSPDAEAYWELALHGVSDRIPVSRRSWPEVKQVVPEVLQ
jgi:two-component system response regulator AlgR